MRNDSANKLQLYGPSTNDTMPSTDGRRFLFPRKSRKTRTERSTQVKFTSCCSLSGSYGAWHRPISRLACRLPVYYVTRTGRRNRVRNTDRREKALNPPEGFFLVRHTQNSLSTPCGYLVATRRSRRHRFRLHATVGP